MSVPKDRLNKTNKMRIRTANKFEWIGTELKTQAPQYKQTEIVVHFVH